MFNEGEVYSRAEISKRIGGGTQNCLSHVNGRVVAVCLTPSMNPQAPFVMLVGHGRDKERFSEILCNDQRNEAVRIFTKRGNSAWEYNGFFKVRAYSKTQSMITSYAKMANRNDVYMVIHFDKIHC